MPKENKPRKSEKQVKPKKAVSGQELSDKDLDNVTGGAVDAFIWFKDSQDGMSAPEGETQDDAYNTGSFAFPVGVKPR